MPLSPRSCWNLTISRMARSSTERSSFAGSVPCFAASRASSRYLGRRKLPTWSARNGGAALMAPILAYDGLKVRRLQRLLGDRTPLRGPRPHGARIADQDDVHVFGVGKRALHDLSRSLGVHAQQLLAIGVDIAGRKPVQVQLRKRPGPIRGGLERQRVLAENVAARSGKARGADALVLQAIQRL